MAKKTDFWNIRNPITSFKAIVANIISLLILIIPLAAAYWFINEKSMLVIGRIIQILSFIFYLWLWGYIANKFWKWD